jgi:hypothetical protein
VRSEVKGIWFVTARRYIQQEYGQEVFDRYVAAVPEYIRADVIDPVVSAWYPEEMLRDALAAFHTEVAGGNDDVFSNAMERCSVLGVHWFVQILLSVATPEYLLKLMPATLRITRRGPVRVAVQTGDHCATLRFTGQPYAGDPRYRLATPAIIRGILGLCVGPTITTHLSYADSAIQVCEARW